MAGAEIEIFLGIQGMTSCVQSLNLCRFDVIDNKARLIENMFGRKPVLSHCLKMIVN